MAALGIQYALAGRFYYILYALQHSDIPGGSAVVVAYKRGTAVGVGADDTDGLKALKVKGEYAVVFQEHQALCGGLSGEGKVLRGLHVQTV